VFRDRLEYPDLKRAVRAQRQMFSASVVLIEDKASGTPLIQELNREGPGVVTQCKPEGDKVMRMRAQTAMIEDHRVHLPTDAPWLDDYLYELAVFPKGKHNDQVDSTSQFLDWFNTPMPSWGIFEVTRRQAEKLPPCERIPKFERVKPRYAIGSMEWQAEQQLKNETEGGQ
jgi:predicted phage terminase large subunit-like protein